jgi:hypothetical protein
MAGASPAMTEKHTVVGVRHCERSEAIHGATSRDMDCFVASFLAVTELDIGADMSKQKGLRDHLAQPFVVKPYG